MINRAANPFCAPEGRFSISDFASPDGWGTGVEAADRSPEHPETELFQRLNLEDFYLIRERRMTREFLVLSCLQRVPWCNAQNPCRYKIHTTADCFAGKKKGVVDDGFPSSASFGSSPYFDNSSFPNF